MYKGNMKDFVDRLSVHTSEKYGVGFRLSEVKQWNITVDKNGKYVQAPEQRILRIIPIVQGIDEQQSFDKLWPKVKQLVYGKTVFDSDTFEQDVYEYVNQVIEGYC
jgi:hypothetical protein